MDARQLLAFREARTHLSASELFMSPHYHLPAAPLKLTNNCLRVACIGVNHRKAGVSATLERPFLLISAHSFAQCSHNWSLMLVHS